MNNIEKLKGIGWYPNRRIELLDHDYNWGDNVPIANKFIEEFGGLKYTSKKNNITFIFTQRCNKWYINSYIDNIKVSKIARVINALLGPLDLVVNEKEEIYILEYKQKIADSIENLFEKIFAEDFDIQVQIDQKTYEELDMAGWYAERKADISLMVNKLNSAGIDVFPKAYKFYEQFYGLTGKTWGEKKWNWEIYNEDDIINEDYRIGALNISEMYLPICRVDDDMIYYFISESGKIYNEMNSLVGNNFIEGMNSILSS